MSKLAALAAKRRQKESANTTAPEKTEGTDPRDEYAASLSKLSLGDASRRRNLKDKDDDVVTKNGSSAQDKEATRDIIEPLVAKNPEDEPIVERIRPSAFADTFLNATPTASSTSSIDPDLLKSTTPMFDFKDPSPDDIVYKAQTGRAR